MRKIIYPEDPDYEDYKSNRDYEECEYCHSLINFDMLGDEEIITQREGMIEYWGAMVSMPDSVAGFICLGCGNENRF